MNHSFYKQKSKIAWSKKREKRRRKRKEEMKYAFFYDIPRNKDYIFCNARAVLYNLRKSSSINYSFFFQRDAG